MKEGVYYPDEEDSDWLKEVGKEKQKPEKSEGLKKDFKIGWTSESRAGALAQRGSKSQEAVSGVMRKMNPEPERAFQEAENPNWMKKNGEILDKSIASGELSTEDISTALKKNLVEKGKIDVVGANGALLVNRLSEKQALDVLEAVKKEGMSKDMWTEDLAGSLLDNTQSGKVKAQICSEIRKRGEHFLPTELIFNDPASSKEFEMGFAFKWLHTGRTPSENFRKLAVIEGAVGKALPNQSGMCNFRTVRAGFKPLEPTSSTVKAVKDMYNKTQADFSNRGVREVELYRGTKKKETAYSRVESWAGNEGSARLFTGVSKMNIMKKRIPVRNILTSHRTTEDKFIRDNYESVDEYIVLGGH